MNFLTWLLHHGRHELGTISLRLEHWEPIHERDEGSDDFSLIGFDDISFAT